MLPASTWLTLLLGSFLPSPWNAFQASYDERLLGPGPAGMTLPERFRANMLTPEEVRHVRLLLSRLGDDDYRLREKAFHELHSWRPGAEVLLRRQLGGGDLERDRRIRQILDRRLGRWNPSQEEAAVRLAKRAPSAETARLLLDYLPFTEDAGVLAEIASTLRGCTVLDHDIATLVHSGLDRLDGELRDRMRTALQPGAEEPSPTVRAADLARLFFALVAEGNTARLAEVIELPFHLGNGLILTTTEQRDDFFRQAVVNYRDAGAGTTLTFLQVCRGDDYLRLAAADGTESLRDLPGHALRAVHVRMRRSWPQEEFGAVLVRVGPRECRIVGLGYTVVGPGRSK